MNIKLNKFDISRFFDEEFQLFDTTEVSFTNDVVYSDTKDIDPDILNELKTFGVIEKRNMYVIPANLPFKIIKPSFNISYFDIVRNNTTLEICDIDEAEINIELSEFGKKCETASKLLGISIEKAREDIIQYSKCFNIIVS